MSPERINVLGIGVSAVDIPCTLDTIDCWIVGGDKQYVCVTGVHGIVESQHDGDLLKIHNRAGLVVPDGMPLVWLLWLSGHAEADRVYGPDLMLAVLKHGRRRGYRHFLYGATEETLRRLEANVARAHPDARIVGRIAPPFRPLSAAEERAVTSAINDSGADIVWVGLSTPKQERWMAAFRNRLDANVLIGVGAAFDFHAGSVRQAPRFVQRSGFEWAFRLMMEPRRLWRRYARNNPEFLWKLISQKIGGHDFPIRR